jgi:precorrin-3B C17-methyltransferase
VYGYGPYLARVPERAGQARHASDNRVERDRAAAALEAAAAGRAGRDGVGRRSGCLRHGSGGLRDGGGRAAGMARARHRGASGRHRDAGAGRAGGRAAGRGFLRHLAVGQPQALGGGGAAAGGGGEAGFVIALYNPISRARPWQLGAAYELLRTRLPGTTPVLRGRAVAREAESVEVTTLAEADPARADMASCILIGSALTRVVARPGRAPLVYTPRSIPA